MRSHRHSRAAEITAGLASLLLLTAAIAGLPILLTAVAGSPIPNHVPSWHAALGALTHRDSGMLFLAALRDVAWAAWAAFTLSVGLEVVCGAKAPRLLGLGGMQHVARSLIAAVAVAFSASSGAGLPAIMLPAVAAADTVHAATPPAAAVLEAAHRPAGAQMVTVRPGDTLWGIAEHHLGDAERWPEIARLNNGRLMPGGARFTDLRPGLILPGFGLRMPSPAGRHSHPGPAGSGHRAAHPHHAGHQAGHPDAAGQQAGPPAAMPAPDTAPAASVTALPDAGQHTPTGPVAAAFTLGMVSGGLVATVAGMRHRQRQGRGRGRRIALPTSQAARRAEHQLREAAERPLPSVLRDALAALADGLHAAGAPLPGIAGVHLTAAATEILLTEPAPDPPAPYRPKPGTQDMCWTLVAGPEDSPPAGEERARGDLLPGLCTAGITAGGGYLLTDLEDLGILTVDGPDTLTGQTVFAAAVELATNMWAGAYDLVLAGFPELDGVGRAQACVDLGEALEVLAGRARQLAALPPGPPVRARRLTDPACADYGLTVLVSRIVPEPGQMAKLLDTARPGSGIAALIAGDVRAPDGREAPASLDLHGDNGRPGAAEAVLHPLGIVLTPQVFSGESHQAVREIFQAASAPDVGPADPPYDSNGIADWAPAGDAAEGGAVDLRSQTPDLDGPNVLLGEAPAGPAPPPEPEPDAGQLQITILGPFAIAGAAAELQPKHAELVLALALAGQAGLPGSALRMMLGSSADRPKSADSLRQIITRTRRELGQAADGSEYVIHAGNSRYILHSSAWLDWHAFRAQAEAGRSRRDPAILWDALALVRGRPLDGVYHWWVETALGEEIRAEITDAAGQLAELELAAGEPTAARRAARIGLAADPAAEPLWRALMHAEDASGNSAGVHHAWQECLTAVADIAPDGEPHADTIALYSQLTRRRPAAAGVS